MGSIMNGMALHGGVIPYGGTFLIFSDYMRPADPPRGAMDQHVIYVFTHDSIGLGEDGPTHQPVEQLTALRAIPNLTVIRPADAAETAEAWRVALKHKGGPVALVLTRQKLGFIDRREVGAATRRRAGRLRARARRRGGEPEVVLMSSGSEVALVLEAQEQLERRACARARREHAEPRAVRAAAAAYRDEVLPAGVRARRDRGRASDVVASLDARRRRRARHRALRRVGAVPEDLRGARHHGRRRRGSGIVVSRVKAIHRRGRGGRRGFVGQTSASFAFSAVNVLEVRAWRADWSASARPLTPGNGFRT